MELGDNHYNVNDPKYSFLEKYKTAQMQSNADFYGKVADDHGEKAESLENGLQAKDTTNADIGKAMAKGDTGADMAANGLMASGNPYAMAAGGVLKVASMGQKREQAKLDATRAAFVERQNKMRDATDKLIAMDYGI